jgi:hypothetical protein
MVNLVIEPQTPHGLDCGAHQTKVGAVEAVLCVSGVFSVYDH